MSILLLVAFGVHVGTSSFAGVTDPHAARSWTKDGVPLPRLIWPDMFEHVKYEGENPSKEKWLFVLLAGEKEMPSITFRLDAGKGSVHSGQSLNVVQKDGTWLTGCSFQTEEPTLKVSYGISTAPWQTVGSYLADRKKSFGIAFNPSIASSKKNLITVQATIPDGGSRRDYRLVARSRRGELLIPGGMNRSGREGYRPTFFFNGKAGDVERVELQTRPFTWFNVGAVQVYPRG